MAMMQARQLQLLGKQSHKNAIYITHLNPLAKDQSEQRKRVTSLYCNKEERTLHKLMSSNIIFA